MRVRVPGLMEHDGGSDGVSVADDQLEDAEITEIEFVDTTSAAGDHFAMDSHMFEPKVEKDPFGRIRLPSRGPVSSPTHARQETGINGS